MAGTAPLRQCFTLLSLWAKALYGAEPPEVNGSGG